EEGTDRKGRGASCFVIDPIDGTAAFVAGLPTWCVCLGLMDAGSPRAGVVHLPCSREFYTAVDGRAWWNGVALGRLGDASPPVDPFVAVHSKAHRQHPFQRLPKLRSLGSAAYHTVLVARGVARAALLGDVRVWDLAAAGAALPAGGGGVVRAARRWPFRARYAAGRAAGAGRRPGGVAGGHRGAADTARRLRASRPPRDSVSGRHGEWAWDMMNSADGVPRAAKPPRR